MNVFVCTIEPYHDNSEIVGVALSLQDAKEKFDKVVKWDEFQTSKEQRGWYGLFNDGSWAWEVQITEVEVIGS